MQHHENEEDWVQAVRVPEPIVQTFAYNWLSEKIHDSHDQRQHNSREACYGSPSPVMKFWYLVGSKIVFIYFV